MFDGHEHPPSTHTPVHQSELTTRSHWNLPQQQSNTARKRQGEPSEIGSQISKLVHKFWSLVKKDKKESAHEKDRNCEPFEKNETTSERVHKNWFTNSLASTDVLGQNV